MRYYIKNITRTETYFYKRPDVLYNLEIHIYTSKDNHFIRLFICQRKPTKVMLDEMIRRSTFIECNIFKWIKYKIWGI